MSEEERRLVLRHIHEELAKIKAAVDELLRRVPEPRCQMCGFGSGYHSQQFGADHEFTP